VSSRIAGRIPTDGTIGEGTAGTSTVIGTGAPAPTFGTVIGIAVSDITEMRQVAPVECGRRDRIARRCAGTLPKMAAFPTGMKGA
jgi:hypothetical protein